MQTSKHACFRFFQSLESFPIIGKMVARFSNARTVGFVRRGKPGWNPALHNIASILNTLWRAGFHPGRITRRAFLLLLLLAAFLIPHSAFSAPFALNTDYQNYWFRPSPEGGAYSNYFKAWPDAGVPLASTPVYQGHALGNTNAAVPHDGTAFGLSWSAFAQPVESVVSDVALGSVITPPDGADTNVPPANFVAKKTGNNTNAYYECTNPSGAAFFVPSTKQIIAAQPNNCSIDWIMLDGSTNTQVLTISPIPKKRPVRLFWTEKPYDAPAVNLQGLFPVLHYNAEVPPVVYNVTTNYNGGYTNIQSNVVSGVWLDDQKNLRGINVSGRFVLEYYEEGTYSEQVKPLGIEIVEVLKPGVVNIDADIGSRLQPQDNYWQSVDGDRNIHPYINAGLNDTVFVYDNEESAKDDWVFSIKKTVEEAWSLQIYWQNRGIMGVLWPFEYAWYSCDWPDDPQLYVMAGEDQPQPGVLIPEGLEAELQPFMEPDLHAQLDVSKKTFTADEPGFSLLKFTDSVNADIWFEVVQTVVHTNENYYNLSPQTVEIGKELRAPDGDARALYFNSNPTNPAALNDYVLMAESWLNQRSDWSMSFWFKSDGMSTTTNPACLYGESDGAPNTRHVMFAIMLNDATGQLGFWGFNQQNTDAPGKTTRIYSATNVVAANTWHYLAVSCAGGTDSNGTLSVWLDNELLIQTQRFPRVYGEGRSEYFRATIAATPVSENAANYNAVEPNYSGHFDNLSIWREALSQQQLWKNRYKSTFVYRASLLARYMFDEGEGDVVHNETGSNDGAVYGDPVWGYGHHEPEEAGRLDVFPGYVYAPNGDRYNKNRYSYPVDAADSYASYIFPVNDGLLEIWWANRSRQENMPPVYYPSYVERFRAQWPTNYAGEIVIASGKGATYSMADVSVYYQNLTNQPGYNPDEEHAVLMSSKIYALRDDLNTTNTSHVAVLLDGIDRTTGRPAMELFSVVRTNAQYQFAYSTKAGLPIVPPMPVGAMPLCQKTYSSTQPPAWRDRKLGWWARSADDDGTNNAIAMMFFYYPMQPAFWFPSLTPEEQPAPGTDIPWLSRQGHVGDPILMNYDIAWPDNIPTIKIGQTLTTATRGLPDIWNQLSVETIYQQSEQQGLSNSVTLFDPLLIRGTPLASDMVDKLISSKRAARELTSSKVRFPDLSPSLYPRIYYDPDRGSDGELVIEGQRVEPLTGDAYLLINALAPFEKQQAATVAQGMDADVQDAWNEAINLLPDNIELIQPNKPYVKAALYAGLGKGVGKVTLAMNNSTNEQQVPRGLPVSLYIINVVPELWSGQIEVILPDDVLDEQLTLRASPDFAGKVEDYNFEWYWAEPAGGLIPNTNFSTWNVYQIGTATNEVTVSGASPFTIGDHYFALRYRRAETNGPTGTNWSTWVYQFAPGWVQRVMNGINPFQQCYADKVAQAVDTRTSMLEMAGPPYLGDVALNKDAACSGGLIPLYQTVLNRAADFSINTGIDDNPANQALKFAVTRLNDLYMFLGNEAYADAMDPTIAYPASLYSESYGGEATSIFCFMNQLPSLIDEELALLRGRNNILEPSIKLQPVFNRLIWNFTAGIDGGEPAYAYNYNIIGATTSSVGTITATDAKRMYPQGHGDAWGHYLSAMSGYYKLLSNLNFEWHTEPGATLVGNTGVSTDFLDEQKFAEAAAAKARAGVQIAELVHRKNYSENPEDLWEGFSDTNTNEAWGVAGWCARAGQGSYFDWAVVNSLLLENLTNMTQLGPDRPNRPPEGIERIDRRTVPELAEIAAAHESIQNTLDNAAQGVSPLGLARNVVPFDISPAEIDAGKTHFEQIYERAVYALQNACIAFDHARGITLKLRDQFNSVYDLEAQLSDNEIDYHNQLVALYGYPYADDIGPTGNYPQGYDGPDLLNWQILDLENLVANVPLIGQTMTVQVYNIEFTAPGSLTGQKYTDYQNYSVNYTKDNLTNMTITVGASGLKIKPSSWTGQRRAEGELQRALRDYVVQWYALKAKIEQYNKTLYGIEMDLLNRQADYNAYLNEWKDFDENIANRRSTAQRVYGLRISQNVLSATANTVAQIAYAAATGVPSVQAGAFGPFPAAMATEDIGSAVRIAAAIALGVDYMSSVGLESGALGREEAQERWTASLEGLMGDNQYAELLRTRTRDSLVELREQYIQQADLQQEVAALSQTYSRIRQLLAEGQRLLVARARIRARASQRIQMNRYSDMTLRIFRDDTLRRYRQSFDLAARYAYLAAKAYDYETGLLSTDTETTPGSKYMESVVRARALGRLDSWYRYPLIGGASGDPGLADILARMYADWDVVKGRFGFNNPEEETSRFSMRTENFRISPLTEGNTRWADLLESCRVDDLRSLPDYVTRCIPFSSGTNAEPALVIPFSTMIVAGKNYFGHDLAGGDNAYDPSQHATKIRSAGVWFTGYNTTFPTNSTSGGLANQPRVYLIPVGEDIMRSPTRGGLELRNWKVLDQAMPLPFNIGGSDIDDPDWLPMVHSLTESFALERRFPAMRAYHDKGQFDADETISNSRLVGRSVWNTKWLLIIPGRLLLSDPDAAIDRFIYGPQLDGKGIKDIKISFQTYSIQGE
jgi:hypothetical protein